MPEGESTERPPVPQRQKKLTGGAKTRAASTRKIQQTLAEKAGQPDGAETFPNQFGALMKEGGIEALRETRTRIENRLHDEPETTFKDIDISREKIKELMAGLIGAGSGAVGLMAVGEHMGQDVASLTGVLDEPAAALAVLTLLTVKKVKEVRGRGEKFGSWLKQSLKDKVTQLGLTVSGALPIESPMQKAKATATLAAVSALAYWAYKDPSIAEPVNAFLGAGVGTFLALHGRELIVGHENFEEALNAYVRREFPDAAHELYKMRHAEGITNAAKGHQHEGRTRMSSPRAEVTRTERHAPGFRGAKNMAGGGGERGRGRSRDNEADSQTRRTKQHFSRPQTTTEIGRKPND